MGSTVPLLPRIAAHDASNRPINVHAPSQTSRTLREPSVIPGLRAPKLAATEMALAVAGIPHRKGGVQVAMDLITSSARRSLHSCGSFDLFAVW